MFLNLNLNSIPISNYTAKGNKQLKSKKHDNFILIISGNVRR